MFVPLVFVFGEIKFQLHFVISFAFYHKILPFVDNSCQFNSECLYATVRSSDPGCGYFHTLFESKC